MSQKSILAKLLATENIHVQHGNYETAWFDIKNRVLGLPQWADKGKDVNDLLIGHEVGHALETPFEGWHDSPEKLDGCPRTYINVVEDARIERKIKSRYVGLVGPFQRGYEKLFTEGFFGKKFDFNNMKLIDKINLKAKVGAHLDIPFNPEEEALYKATMNTDTFDDVVQVVRDILAYTKDNTPELITPPPVEETPDIDLPGEEDGEDQGPQNTGHDDYEMPETGEEEQSESADSEDSDDRKETNNSSSSSDDEETLSAEEDSKDESKPSHDEDISETDEAFRRKERDLLDFSDERDGDQPMVMNGFDRDTIKKIIVDKDRLFAARDKAKETDYNINDDYTDGPLYDDYQEEFTKYYKKVQKDVGFAVKEFELKKAAYRWTRAQTARSGSIDVSRLWAYKTDDDIFARVTQLADAKNHGLIGLIDYSGSMANVMGDVLDQLVHLAVFCKKVNIPFDFYGFTTNNKLLERQNQKEGDMECQGLSMPNILSSSFNKSDFEKAVYHCFVRKQRAVDYWGAAERSICSPEEDYGSTPLNEALVVTTSIIKDFQRKHNVDKMNLVVISDGDANSSHVYHSYRSEKDVQIKRVPTSYYGDAIIRVDGRQVRAARSRRAMTSALLQNLSKNYGANTIGFFIADGSHNWKNKLMDLYETEDNNYFYSHEGNEWRKERNKEYRKNKCVIFNDMHGYETYYLLKGGPKTLKTEGEEFAPEVGSTKGQLTSAFRNAAKSGKTNKVLLKNFGGAVA